MGVFFLRYALERKKGSETKSIAAQAEALVMIYLGQKVGQSDQG